MSISIFEHIQRVRRAVNESEKPVAASVTTPEPIWAEFEPDWHLSYEAAMGKRQIWPGRNVRRGELPSGYVPMDAEMQEAVSEHLLGYWDYILVTGAINRLTADREEGEDGEVAEEAVSGQ